MKMKFSNINIFQHELNTCSTQTIRNWQRLHENGVPFMSFGFSAQISAHADYTTSVIFKSLHDIQCTAVEQKGISWRPTSVWTPLIIRDACSSTSAKFVLLMFVFDCDFWLADNKAELFCVRLRDSATLD